MSIDGGGSRRREVPEPYLDYSRWRVALVAVGGRGDCDGSVGPSAPF